MFSKLLISRQTIYIATTMSEIQSYQGPDPQTLIARERANPSFDKNKMHVFLEGGDEKNAATIKSLIQQMERDPILAADTKQYDLNKEQQREVTAVKINRLSRYIEKDGFDLFNKRMSIVGIFDPQVGTRLGIHLGLFLNAVRGNGTEEQFKFWALTKESAYVKGIYGCFAMTELGHGSNVAGLETTATYDIESDEFIVNTPHIGATKWWIGGAAHSSTHAVVYARLVVKGEDFGVKTFIVPLRDTNHDLYPGVVTGDIGAKMGRDGIDNGWIQFSNVRIPRFFMLQKFAKVDREGNVTEPPIAQLAYSALIGGRVSMVTDSYRTGARFITIALRYAVGRRQFKVKSKDENENQLIDYPLHQRRLIPFLSIVYAISCGSYKLEQSQVDTLKRLDEAVKTNNIKELMASIELLKALFVDSASLKSTCTWLIADLIDQSRQACGGQGYSAYSGFGKGYNDWVVQCTWEGDNNILAIGAGKPIVQGLIAATKKNKKASGELSFINNFANYINDDIILDSSKVSDLSSLLVAIEATIIRLSYSCSKLYEESKDGWDSLAVHLITISKFKAHHYLLKEFISRIKKADSSLTQELTKLALLYSYTIINLFSGTFLSYKILSADTLNDITDKKLNTLCSEIRTDVITLTDSFMYSDMIINSSLGSYNGNIYENIFKITKNQNPPSNSKAPYTDIFKANLGRSSLNERERHEKSEEVSKILSK